MRPTTGSMALTGQISNTARNRHQPSAFIASVITSCPVTNTNLHPAGLWLQEQGSLLVRPGCMSLRMFQQSKLISSFWKAGLLQSLQRRPSAWPGFDNSDVLFDFVPSAYIGRGRAQGQAGLPCLMTTTLTTAFHANPTRLGRRPHLPTRPDKAWINQPQPVLPE